MEIDPVARSIPFTSGNTLNISLRASSKKAVLVLVSYCCCLENKGAEQQEFQIVHEVLVTTCW